MKVAEIVMIHAPKNFYTASAPALHQIIFELRKTVPYDRNDHVNILEMTIAEYLKVII